MEELHSNGRPRRRRRWRSRAKRWLRVLWPLVPLVAAVLLSVGVIRVVESGPDSASPVALPDPGTLDALDHLDVELYDEGVFWDESRLRRAAREQKMEIRLQSEEAVPEMGELIPRSFLDEPPAFDVEVPDSYGPGA